MNSNLKIIIYCDEEIYQQIYNKYTYFDETSNMRFHFFDRNNPDIKHITTNRFINFSITILCKSGISFMPMPLLSVIIFLLF